MENIENKRKCVVLLVEDNAINQKLVVLMLGKLGVACVVADGGQLAVDKAISQSFDLILMDLHMPGMDGIEATRRIKAELGEKSPPVIALTADVVPGSIDQAMRNGIDAYLTKPINRDQLKETIEKHCGCSL